MTQLHGHNQRKFDYNFSILDSDDAIIAPGTNDKVRVKIGRRCGATQTPTIDLLSGTASANGSTLTKDGAGAGIHELRIVQADMALLNPGVYTFEALLVDNADSQAAKHANHEVFTVEGTMAGSLGL